VKEGEIMAFKKAEREQLYLRCAVYGPSGSGKTMTAMRMAKGIAEKMGVPFAVIDTEARSASKYADRFDFEVDDLEKKTVEHYIASMNEAANAGYKVLVIDSLTHGWRGLTDEVDRISANSASKNTFSPWAKVNPKQKRFIDAILNYPGHIIVTMRSKTEWVIGEGKDGKTAPKMLGLAPEQGKGIEYEFDLLMELNQSHQAHVTKDRTGKFQDESIDKPGEDFGVALYQWLMSGTKAKPAAQTPLPKQSASSPASRSPASSGKATATLKERSKALINEIGGIVTAAENGLEYFSEAERNGTRQIIQSTKINEDGVKGLSTLKDFLAEELSKRSEKAA
jgi:hypothetical protein